MPHRTRRSGPGFDTSAQRRPRPGAPRATRESGASFRPPHREPAQHFDVVETAPAPARVLAAQRAVCRARAALIRWPGTTLDGLDQRFHIVFRDPEAGVIPRFRIERAPAGLFIRCDALKPAIGALDHLERYVVRAGVGGELY